MTVLSAATLLFLVMDPLGNTPLFVSQLARLGPRRARWVTLRELLIALLILVLFLLWGKYILEAIQVTPPSLNVSGGVVLFLVALKMVFPETHETAGTPDEEPFIVPLAIPFVAGPSTIATVMLLNAQHPDRWLDWLLALVLAWLVTGGVLLSAGSLSRFLGTRGLRALERLMGMLLITVAVEMFLKGIQEFFGIRAGPGAP